MPTASPSAIRQQIAANTLAPVYLIVGDDDVEMSRLANDLSSVVEDELRAFNLERLYASDKGVTARSIAEAARTLPMLGERRVVIVLRAEKILKPKRRRRHRRRGRHRAAERPRRPRGLRQGSLPADNPRIRRRRRRPTTSLVQSAGKARDHRRVLGAACWQGRQSGLASGRADGRATREASGGRRRVTHRRGRGPVGRRAGRRRHRKAAWGPRSPAAVHIG